MSLDVPPALLEQAQAGEIRNDDFLQCIKESLPYAWQLIEGLANPWIPNVSEVSVNAFFVDYDSAIAAHQAVWRRGNIPLGCPTSRVKHVRKHSGREGWGASDKGSDSCLIWRTYVC